MDSIVYGITKSRTRPSNFTSLHFTQKGDSQVALVVKNPLVNAGDIRDAGSIPGSGRSPGGEHDNPLQYSCLENSMYRGALQAKIHRVTKSRTQPKQLSMHARKSFTAAVPNIFGTRN